MTALLADLITLYILVILVGVVLSWFPLQPGGAGEGVYRFTRTLTDPVMEPVRRALPRTGMIDLSPMVVVIVLSVVRQALIT